MTASDSSKSSLSANDRGNQRLWDVKTRHLIYRLLRDFLYPYRRHVIIGALLLSCAALSQAAVTFLLKDYIDDVLLSGSESKLWMVALALVLLGPLRGACMFGQALALTSAAIGVVADLQSRMFQSLTSMDEAQLDNEPAGRLIARFTNDLWAMRAALQNGVIGCARDVTLFVCLVLSMIWHDWMMALLAMIILPAAIPPLARIARRLRKATHRVQEQTSQLAVLVDEALYGRRAIKLAVSQEEECQRFTKAAHENRALFLKGVRTRALNHPLMESLTALGIASVLLHGGQRVIAGDLSLGAFLAFLVSALMTYQPLKSLSNLHNVIQEGIAAAIRVFDVIDTQPTVVSHPEAIELVLDQHDSQTFSQKAYSQKCRAKKTSIRRASGPEICFRDVIFRHYNLTASAAPTLNRLSLTAPASKRTALVGPSGAGKSTILDLIPRFYDLDEGAILINGTDIRELTLSSLRHQIAFVTQEPILFHDSIKANISYGLSHKPQKDIETAAKAAGAHDFIMSLSQGYDSLVGPRGTRLSGGQAQRIVIARALLKEAPILLLDEATSALDSESEALIQKALAELMQGRTTLVVAHRLVTVTSADHIYVIEAGQVAESGSHTELTQHQGGLYHRLATLQSTGEVA